MWFPERNLAHQREYVLVITPKLLISASNKLKEKKLSVIPLIHLKKNILLQ